METVSLDEAYEKLNNTLKVLNIEPDEGMKKQMASWAKYRPDFEKSRISFTADFFNKDFKGWVAVRPHVDGGRFVVIGFSAPNGFKIPNPATIPKPQVPEM